MVLLRRHLARGSILNYQHKRHMWMKNSAISCLLILLLTACESAPMNGASLATESTPPPTQITSTNSTSQPSVSPTPGATELFITQVMATKYAAQTQYAALPTVTPTPTIPPDSPACKPSDLQTTVHLNGATGRIALEVGVTNTSKTACFLPSWPKVELLDNSGKALDIVYEYDYLNANPSSLPPTQENNPGEPLVYGMEANQTAGLFLLWGNWCQGTVQGGVIMRMFLLGSNTWLDISTEAGGGGHCDEPTSPSTIAVFGFGY